KVFPLCRKIHFVVCGCCAQELLLEKGMFKKRENKIDITCSQCKEKLNDEEHQREVLGSVFSLTSQQATPLRLAIKPGMAIKAVTRLARETKVILQNISISDTLFLGLMSRTTVEIKSKITVFPHNNSLDCCLERPYPGIGKEIRICVDGYTSEDLKQIEENIRRMPKRTIILKSQKIHAKEKGVCILLKFLDGSYERNDLFDGVYGCKNLFDGISGAGFEVLLESSERELVKEILGNSSSQIWMGKAKYLMLARRAIEIVPKLRMRDKDNMEKLILYADSPEYISEVINIKNQGILIGNMRNISLRGYAVEMLPKFKFHEENQINGITLSADHCDNITRISKAKKRSLLECKVKNLRLERYAVELLSKLRIDEENEMESFSLSADHDTHITGMLGTEKNSIWVGKVKILCLEESAVKVLPKLRIHEENKMEVLSLSVRCSEKGTWLPLIKQNSIWVGKVKKLELRDYAAEMLPKLRFNKENEMEELSLSADRPLPIGKKLQIKQNSIWIGKLKRLKLEGYAVEVLPRLGFHEKNKMEELNLCAVGFEQISGVLKEKDKSIWVGKVKKLSLDRYTKEVEGKLKDPREDNDGDIEMCLFK
ncbi:MAG: uncharacterized protein A8A55_2525, partial [Amphiamblys sp. WSBS2006]